MWVIETIKRLNQGRITGQKYKIDSLGYNVEIYKGIPYAQYNGRWKYASLLSQFPSNPFNGTVKLCRNFSSSISDLPICRNVSILTILAKNEAFVCAQTGSTPDYSAESCLTLDIYRPAGDDKGEILFWIHGGGFATGASSFYSGVEQAGKYGNTVVVIQYRTGFA